MKRHAHTDAEATGVGATAATAPGRRNRVPVLCDINLPPPRWAHSLRADKSQVLLAPAAVALEMGTARAMSKLRARLDTLARASGLQRPVRPLTFERWRWAAKWEEDGPAARSSGHPVLPGAKPKSGAVTKSGAASKKGTPSTKDRAPGNGSAAGALGAAAPAAGAGAGAATGGKDATDALAEDLRMQGIMLSDGYSVARALAQEAAVLAARGEKERVAAGSGKPVLAPPIEVEVHRHSIDLKCGHHFVKVGHAAYAKLAILHRRTITDEAAPEPPAVIDTAAATTANASTNTLAASAAAAKGNAPTPAAPAASAPASLAPAASEGDSSLSYAQVDAEVAALRSDGGETRAALHQRMFALLLRYKSLRGHGFHAAIGPAVWRTLRSRLGVGFEGFASPLNCTLPNYCSGFPDVDGAFGTAGSFFSLSPKQTLGGSFALNPPFVHAILDAAADRALQLLDAAQAAGAQHALSIAFIMPGWKETNAHARLSASPHLRRAITVAAADHGFCDGASHQRQDPFRASPYDTVIFVLQTDRAAKRWPAHDAFETEIRAGMAATVPLASAAERQEKKRKRPLNAGEGEATERKEKKKRKRPDRAAGGEATERQETKKRAGPSPAGEAASGDGEATERQKKNKRKRPSPARDEAGAGARKPTKRVAAAAGGAHDKVRPSGDGGPMNSPADLARFKKEIDAWVTAKRSKVFVTADKLRAELREGGVDVEKARPKGKGGGAKGGGGAKKAPAEEMGVAKAVAAQPKKRKHERPKKKGREEEE